MSRCPDITGKAFSTFGGHRRASQNVMSNYFVAYWECNKCIFAAVEARSKYAAKDVLDWIRDGLLVKYQRGGSVTLGYCECSEGKTASLNNEGEPK